jgi:phage/plasmid-like protein (TIGR03299 family)
MAHNIGEMFYYGKRPWHGLGTEVERPANLEQALDAGRLDWEVGMVPIVPFDEPDSVIAHRLAVVRKDKLLGQQGRVIGVVHPGYRPLQNRAGAKMFDDLLGQGQGVYHTGGYLKNGEVIWLLARLPEDIRVNGHDVLETYLLFTNSHDGSLPIDIRLTTVRVVCNNTLTIALEGYGLNKVFKRGHDGSNAIIKAEAKQFFNFAIQQTKKTEELFTRLSKMKCNKTDFEQFLDKLMPDIRRPITAESSSSVRKSHETRMKTLIETKEQVINVHEHGIQSMKIAPSDDTWWGALNTITAWVDHVQPSKNDRYAHILLGGGNQMKSKALSEIIAITKVR